MIVDTSALIAILLREQEFQKLLDAVLSVPSLVPAPVLIEFHRVASRRRDGLGVGAGALLGGLLDRGLMIETFTGQDANLTVEANIRFGAGNGRGGILNLLDLMVYGMARRTGLPILCTGEDFAATDIGIHPASRGW